MKPSRRRASPCLRQLGVKDDADFRHPHGGAIALGHPLGMSGARLAMTAGARHGGSRGKNARWRTMMRRRRPRASQSLIEKLN